MSYPPAKRDNRQSGSEGLTAQVTLFAGIERSDCIAATVAETYECNFLTELHALRTSFSTFGESNVTWGFISYLNLVLSLRKTSWSDTGSIRSNPLLILLELFQECLYFALSVAYGARQPLTIS